MSKRIGFVGCGNMGGAMLQALVEKGFSKKEDVLVSTKRRESRERWVKECGVIGKESNREVVAEAEIIILAVKPYMYEKVIEEVKDLIDSKKIIISIAAGVSMVDLENWLGGDKKIIRSMPNTPALVGEGMSAICPNRNINREELKEISDMFNVFGKCELLEEKDFHGFIALCGSSPAYIFMIIEAMADGGVKLGLPRDKAYKLAAQSVLGSAKMVLETGKHPGVLKDMVCSPGGTTIAAVADLEKNGIRNDMISAIEVCAEKSKNM